MLLELHVKNLALIAEERISFGEGLNILTGETGAGKSILIGSVNLALGGKADKGVIRDGADEAMIELSFEEKDESKLQTIRGLDLPVDEDGIIVIKRRITKERSTATVNGEAASARQLRQLGGCLIDIYGQRENQTLLKRSRQLSILDDYAGKEGEALLSDVRNHYRTYASLREEWENGGKDEATRKREEELLDYEIDELESAAVRQGECAALEKDYRRLSQAGKLATAIQTVLELTDGEEGASDAVSRGCRELAAVQGADEDLDAAAETLSEIDSLLSDFNRSLADCAESLQFEPDAFVAMEDRLDLLHHLEDKYGCPADRLGDALKERLDKKDALASYTERRAKLKEDLRKEKEAYYAAARKLSAVRRKAGDHFCAKMQEELLDLNFNQVSFTLELTQDEEHPSADGIDSAVFLISMNPGEPARPLDLIASGGELSRIMLALKTVFAGKDDIHTFIFDEIDTGISGQTAWKVAEKLGRLSADHQILAITHLPQIAAMNDVHFLIRKDSEGGRTFTHIRKLTEGESTGEAARLLGGEKITDAVRKNAEELRAEARAVKERNA